MTSQFVVIFWYFLFDKVNIGKNAELNYILVLICWWPSKIYNKISNVKNGFFPNLISMIFQVKVIHLPPRYQGAGANFQDDIAVVIVAKTFQFRTYIRPVCLSFEYHFEKQQLYTGNQGKVGNKSKAFSLSLLK